MEDELDEGLAESFPASDPPALTSPASVRVREKEAEISQEPAQSPPPA